MIDNGTIYRSRLNTKELIYQEIDTSMYRDKVEITMFGNNKAYDWWKKREGQQMLWSLVRDDDIVVDQRETRLVFVGFHTRTDEPMEIVLTLDYIT